MVDAGRQFPIAEMFVAPQGEGAHMGKLMNFVRFAGCTVGKPYDASENRFPLYYEKCTTYDGRNFTCDTDFRVKERLSASAIIEQLRKDVRYVLLTGGEPLMHPLSGFVFSLRRNNYQVHVETSGTIKPNLLDPMWVGGIDWMCVSPKQGFLDAYADKGIANEFKLLVDENFVWEKVPESIRREPRKICLSPVNTVNDLNYSNLKLCEKIQDKHPDVRITFQFHKILGCR